MVIMRGITVVTNEGSEKSGKSLNATEMSVAATDVITVIATIHFGYNANIR